MESCTPVDIVVWHYAAKDKQTNYMELCEQDLEEAESLYKQSSDDGNEIGKFFVKYGKNERGTGLMDVDWGL